MISDNDKIVAESDLMIKYSTEIVPEYNQHR